MFRLWSKELLGNNLKYLYISNPSLLYKYIPMCHKKRLDEGLIYCFRYRKTPNTNTRRSTYKHTHIYTYTYRQYVRTYTHMYLKIINTFIFIEFYYIWSFISSTNVIYENQSLKFWSNIRGVIRVNLIVESVDYL